MHTSSGFLHWHWFSLQQLLLFFFFFWYNSHLTKEIGAKIISSLGVMHSTSNPSPTLWLSRTLNILSGNVRCWSKFAVKGSVCSKGLLLCNDLKSLLTCTSYQTMPCTTSQNGWCWRRPLEVTWSKPFPPARPPRTGCPGSCPGGFWRSPRKKKYLYHPNLNMKCIELLS